MLSDISVSLRTAVREIAPLYVMGAAFSVTVFMVFFIVNSPVNVWTLSILVFSIAIWASILRFYLPLETHQGKLLLTGFASLQLFVIAFVFYENPNFEEALLAYNKLKSQPPQFELPTDLNASVITTSGPNRFSIQAGPGAPVTAPRSGEVIYAGRSPDGRGKMLIIKHDDDYTSIISNLDTIYPKLQEKVAKGNVVGTTMASPEVDRNLVYVEIRRNKNSE